jgi:hypothetical protein
MSGGMPPDMLAADLGWGLPTQFRVRPDRVVIMPPGGQHEPGMSQLGEQRLIEAFVAQATVETLDEAVLHRAYPVRCSVTRPGAPSTSEGWLTRSTRCHCD